MRTRALPCRCVRNSGRFPLNEEGVAAGEPLGSEYAVPLDARICGAIRPEIGGVAVVNGVGSPSA